MLIPNQKVMLKWHPKNKQRLESLGYRYTKIGDEVLVDIEDVSVGSKAYVQVKCDYCGKTYMKKYKDYFAQRSNGKDCCIDCVAEKRCETDMVRYGGRSPTCDKKVYEKQRATIRKKYGCDTTFESKDVRDKAKATLMKHYGVTIPSKNKDIVAKIMQSWYNNGTAPASRPQRELCSILKKIYGDENAIINYPLFNMTLDCLVKVDDIYIDVEYDGKYWHKNRKEQDNRRNYYLTRRGYKVLRILANERDMLPEEQQIKDAIDYLVKGNHSIAYIDMNM